MNIYFRVNSSKIRGFYINQMDNAYDYVILDKKNCKASKGDVVIQELTKSDYYLIIERVDKFLHAALLAAYAKGETVKFRIKKSSADKKASKVANKVAYVVIPYDADAQ